MGVLAKVDTFKIQDIVLVKQSVSTVSVDLDMIWWADKQVELFERQGIEPWQTSCWLHTHPAGVKKPSATDEQTMNNSFGSWDFAVMIILTKDDCFYGRVDFNHEFTNGLKQRFRMECPIEVDWTDLAGDPVTPELMAAWEREFTELVSCQTQFGFTERFLDEPGRRYSTAKNRTNTAPTDFTTQKEVEEYVDTCAGFGLDPNDPESFEALYGYWPGSGEFLPF